MRDLAGGIGFHARFSLWRPYREPEPREIVASSTGFVDLGGVNRVIGVKPESFSHFGIDTAVPFERHSVRLRPRRCTRRKQR